MWAHVSVQDSQGWTSVCGLTKVSSCAPLLFEGCASSGMQQLLPRNNISGSL